MSDRLGARCSARSFRTRLGTSRNGYEVTTHLQGYNEITGLHRLTAIMTRLNCKSCSVSYHSTKVSFSLVPSLLYLVLMYKILLSSSCSQSIPFLLYFMSVVHSLSCHVSQTVECHRSTYRISQHTMSNDPSFQCRSLNIARIASGAMKF